MPKGCSIPGCLRPHDSRGYCATHGSQLRSIGKLTPLPKHTHCSVVGCEGKHFAHGLCSKHHQRLKKRGSVEDRPRPRQNPVVRFMKFVSIDPASGCWLWTGSLNEAGYGNFHGGYGESKTKLAHRISYLIHIGPIPEGMTLDHLCRTHNCVNPEHLEPVPGPENTRRGINNSILSAQSAAWAKKKARTHCSKGHLLSEENVKLVRGSRNCIICSKERGRQQYLDKKAGVIRKPKTRCPRGHEYNSQNTKITPRGAIHCRVCRREKRRAKYALGNKNA